MKINLPKTGLFHFGFLWWLTPSVILILIHTTLRWSAIADETLTLYFLDLFRVLIPFQILYFLLHCFLRPRLKFATTIKGSFICNLLTILASRRFMQPDDIFTWWKDWFLHSADMLQIFPSWFVISILLTLLEVVLYMRSRQDLEKTDIVSPAESPILTEEQTGNKATPVESKIVLIESIQQYKTIYRLTPEGISEEIVRNTFEELTVDAGKTMLLVHKSFMVAPDLIERIERDGRNYSLILKHIKKPIPVSRNKLEEVRALL
jgi:hypothetical protein